MGSVFDVAVDLRRGSPSFGQWVGLELSAENRHELWVPAGFAHGFLVLSDSADFVYKCSDYYDPCVRKDARMERSDGWHPMADTARRGDPLVRSETRRGVPLLTAECYP
jgi:dTDP-4-dehydrorhamnose 3,5-epimerase